MARALTPWSPPSFFLHKWVGGQQLGRPDAVLTEQELWEEVILTPTPPPWRMDLFLLMPTRSHLFPTCSSNSFYRNTYKSESQCWSIGASRLSSSALSDDLLCHVPGDQPLPSALS